MASGKRSAGNYLTDQNWDKEEEDGESEEPGTFKSASQDVLSQRKFKSAKRRTTAVGNDDEKKPSPFAAFAGFGGGASLGGGSGFTFGASKPTDAAAKPSSGLFSFGAKTDTAASTGFSFGAKPAQDSTATSGFSFGATKPAATEASGFSFGATKPAVAAEASGFSFGATKPAASESTVPTFGVSKSDSSTAAPLFSFKPASSETDSSKDDQKSDAGKPALSSFWSAPATEQKVDFFASRGGSNESTATTVNGTKETAEETPTDSSDAAKPQESTDTAPSEKPLEDVPAVTKQDNVETDKNSTPEVKNSDSKPAKNREAKYYKQLSSLNVSVLNWIKQHVEKNPCIDLSPVFRDYESHLKDIETKYAPTSVAAAAEKSAEPEKPIPAVTNVFKTPDSSSVSPVPASTALPKLPAIFSSTPISNSGPDATSGAPKFGGNIFSPGLFSHLNNPPPAKEAEKTEAEEEDKPPEPERNTVVEDDAFHTIRCKLFYKKGAAYQDMGIAMLYLKPAGENTQLLIRMETTTGNVLLNINVSGETPMSRVGKNNVSIVSVPNPPVFVKPADGDNSLPLTYLIRVKGTTEADTLLEKLKAGK